MKPRVLWAMSSNHVRRFLGVLAVISVGGVPALQSTATLAGIVVDDTGSQPVPRAVVTIEPADAGESLSAYSDEQGRFRFQGVPPGRYLVTAGKPPTHTLGMYGARDRSSRGTQVRVGPGESIGDLTIVVRRTGAIAGIIRNHVGHPAMGVKVTAVSALGSQSMAAVVTTAHTDAEGAFRLFGLPPGEYVVVSELGSVASGDVEIPSQRDIDRAFAVLADARRATPVIQSGNTETPRSFAFLPTFFPGVADGASAVHVTVSPGEERGAVDFQMVVSPTAVLSGVVTATAGQPVTGLRVQLERPTATAFDPPLPLAARTAKIGSGGSFTFSSVPSGNYNIVATASRPAGPVPDRSAHAVEWARVPVLLTGDDLAGIDVALRPALTLRGRIIVAGAISTPQAAYRSVRIVLDRHEPVRQSPAIPRRHMAAPDANGTFELAGLIPGVYRVSVPSTAEWPWVVAGLTVDERDVLHDGLLVVGETDLRDAKLELTDSPTELTGYIEQPGRIPATEYTVVTYPADPALWTPYSRRVLSVRPDSDGRFRFRALPPGAYLVSVALDVEPADLSRRDILALLAQHSVKVTLVAGEAVVQNLLVTIR